MRGVFTAPYISQSDTHVKVCVSSVRYVTLTLSDRPKNIALVCQFLHSGLISEENSQSTI